MLEHKQFGAGEAAHSSAGVSSYRAMTKTADVSCRIFGAGSSSVTAGQRDELPIGFSTAGCQATFSGMPALSDSPADGARC
jgi:hypothetical protein